MAALFFFLLLAPMAAGQDVSTTSSNWKEHVADKIVNDNGGNGTSWNDAILIASAEELAYFAQQVNKGEAITYRSGSGTAQIEPNGKHATGGGFFGYYFALSADIDLEDHYWTPIGTENKPFKGNFDGRGHCVSRLKVNVKEKVKVNVFEKSDPAYAGLFGNAHEGTIQNLGVRLAKEGVQATGENSAAYAGGIAGKAKIIYCCYVEGPGLVEAVSSQKDVNVNSYSYAGGIVGYLLENLTHCYATVAVKAVSDSKSYAGGITGNASGHKKELSYTYATGAVEATGTSQNNYAGGICGYAQSLTIRNNLALNDFIKGNEKWSNRIVGEMTNTVTSTSNYASPEIVVNGKTVSDEVRSNANGSPNVNLDDFGKVFSGGAGWDTSEPTHLPKLNVRVDDSPNYTKWPNKEGIAPQSPPDATLYLQAIQIANASNRDGSEGKPILIANRAELAYLAKQVNAGKALAVSNGVYGSSINNKTGDDSGFKGIYFALSANIALSYYWTPIGTDNHPFKGNFDGQGYCVSGLKVDGAVEYAGLFGCAKDGTLRNIGVHLAKEGILATSCAGGIAGLAANISNCYVVGDGMIKAGPNDIISVGGIVGNIFGSLSNCYATIDVMAEGDSNSTSYAGGILGYGKSTSSVSYTYSTGNVFAKGGIINYAGGICGITSGELYSNLAANEKIEGDGSISHRIVGRKENSKKFDSNYASATIQVNGAPVTRGDADSWDGAPTYLSTFVDDLTDAGWSSENGWENFSSGTNLPQLKMLYSQQPLKVSDYLSLCPKLYIVSPTGGNLIVKDKDGKELLDGSDLRPGTPLTLEYTEDANYLFSEYLSGSGKSSLGSYSGNSITMTDDDLYLSATFTHQNYYNVYLPQVEGATTDPGSGKYEVEAQDSFRFYLKIDSAYSESQPVVTTDRGETLKPRSTDGAYLVNDVCSDVEVFIDGIFKNPPPVANEAISTDALVPQIWSEGSMLCIRMAEALPSSPVRIFTADGRLHTSFASTPGVNRRQLPTGIYIVRVSETSCKVIIK